MTKLPTARTGPTPPIRVLVVDDSVVVRRMLSDIVTAQPDLELGGSAATASIAFQKITQIAPDVVVLDLEMPEMDGIEAAARIRALSPKLPVLMCSSLTEEGAAATVKALAAGASDCVAKPSSLTGGSRGEALVAFGAELVEKIRALVRRPSPREQPVRLTRPPAAPRVASGVVRPPSIVAIGSSTGGPNALGLLFPALPQGMKVPIVLVQHMPPLFTRMLAERLTASSGIPVKEAAEGDVLEPGRAYIAPGNFHMVVDRRGTSMILRLNQEPPENSCRPAVDVLFRSVAKHYGPSALGVVLTGMGHDGTRGARDIVDAGGSIFVQDAASCVVPSMPTSVGEAGVAHKVVALERMAFEIAARLAAPAPRARIA